MEKIPKYYLEEGLPMYNMLYSDNFKTISEEEFLSKYNIRDDSPIVDDLSSVLVCLSEWSVEKLPAIVLDYIDDHLKEDYSQYEEEFPNYYNLIMERIKYMGKFKQISCGLYHSAALRNDGTIVQWGSNKYGHLDNIPNDKFISVVCGDYSSIGLKEDGTIKSWGDMQIDETNCTFKDISVRNMVLSCIKTDGTVVIFGCDIYNPKGEFIKFLTCLHIYVGLRENGEAVIYDSRGGYSYTTNDNIDIVGGLFHFVMLKRDGSIKTYGSLTPRVKFTKITCGNYHSVGIKENGTLLTWGLNGGHSSPSGKFIKVSCGGYHSVGLREDGTVVTWAYKDYGQLDDNPDGIFIDITCGYNHSVGLRKDGSVVTWGSIDENQRDNEPK